MSNNVCIGVVFGNSNFVKMKISKTLHRVFLWCLRLIKIAENSNVTVFTSFLVCMRIILKCT